MLKKLKKQFILSSLIPIVLVIVFAFCALTIITYYYERSQTIAALRASLAGDVNMSFFPSDELSKNLPVDGPKDRDFNEERLSSVELIAFVDSNKNIAFWETSINSEIEDDTAAVIVEDALDEISADKESTGILPTYNLRYLSVVTDNGYKIAFSDRTSEITTVIFLLRVFAAVSAVILGLMFLVANYMAKKAIEPVEKSWDAQNRFVADASHELKTPLTVILANMDIMQANKDTTVWEQNKWIENTKSEATRMTELVNDMLFLARSDAHVDQSYNFQDINFSHVAEDCVLSFESLAFERGINLTSNVPLDIFVNADETRIKQVMMILIDNAMKYVSDKGNIFVTAEGNQKQVKFTVANTGDPIPSDKQAHLFERFYRVDDSRAREKGGYGLGLSIAQNIITVHEGTLGLDYSNEKGTSFSFTLPIKQGKKK